MPPACDGHDGSVHPLPDRAPLDPAWVRTELARRCVASAVTISDETASTNTDATAAARAGAAHGFVVSTDHQTAGRGRLDRTWIAPPRSGLATSFLLRPTEPLSRWSWLPLVAGLATADAIEAATGVATTLKWPNDVLVAPGRGRHSSRGGGGKLAGILAEQVSTPAGTAVVIGVGINVSLTVGERPVPDATSLLLTGSPSLDRSALLVELVTAVAHRYDEWCVDAPSIASDYVDRCSTLDRSVRVERRSQPDLQGVATGIADDGGLVVSTPSGQVTVMAGDVIHVRPT